MAAKISYIPWFIRGALVAFVFALYALDDASAAPRDETTPETYEVAVGTLFVPQQFDDDDLTEVVLDGWLQSSCDRLLDPKIEVMDDLGIISIELLATRGEIEECLPVVTRYTTVVQLGLLPQGRFEIRTNDGTMSQYMPIAEAPSSGPNAETYADIDRVYVDYAPDRKMDSRWMVILMGRFHTTCEEFDTIRVVDDGKTIEVIPTVRQNGEICAPQARPFIERRFMPDIADAGRYLLRARTARGGAVNYVFSAFE